MGKLRKKYRSMPVQVKASLWFLICSFLQKGISTVSTPIFTRLLSTAEYGQYNVFNSWLGIITIFVTLNLSAGVYTQGLVKFDKDNKILSSSLQGLMLFRLWFGRLYICYLEIFGTAFFINYSPDACHACNDLDNRSIQLLGIRATSRI